GVGDDDAALDSVLPGVAVYGETAQLERVGGVRPDHLDELLVGHRLVVAGLGFGGGGEDRLGQLLALGEAVGQPDAADAAGAAVVAPTGAGDVAAYHALDVDALRLVHDHGAPDQLGR